MPETQKERQETESLTEVQLNDRVKQEWLQISALMDKANIPKMVKVADIADKMPEGTQLDEETRKRIEENETLYLTEPERLDFLVHKCAFYISAASKRKTSDFEPLMRVMKAAKDSDKRIFFILQSDGTCYLTNERSGTPTEIWSSVDEMVVDILAQEKGK